MCNQLNSNKGKQSNQLKKKSYANMCQTMIFSYANPKLTKLGERKCLNPTQEGKEHLQINFVYADLDMSFREISISQQCSNITPND